MASNRVRNIVFNRFSEEVVPRSVREEEFGFLDQIGRDDSLNLLLAVAILGIGAQSTDESKVERVQIVLKRISNEFQEESQAFIRWFINKNNAQIQQPCRRAPWSGR